MVSDRLRLTMEDVAALHTEMAALIRAGVPLDRALADLGRDLSGSIGQALTQIGQRLEAGEPLDQIFQDPTIGIPAPYRVVMEAGIRSGNLTAALEDVATAARRAAETRRIIRYAIAYPVTIALVAYMALVLLVIYFFPLLSDVSEGLLLERTPSIVVMHWLREHLAWWVPWPPVVIALAVWGLGRVTPRDAGLGISARPSRWRKVLQQLSPTYVMRLSQLATLSDLLGLLVAHQVPLDQAVQLAAQATGSNTWITAALDIAQRLQRGETAEAAFRAVPTFPAVAGWLAWGASSHITEAKGAGKSAGPGLSATPSEPLAARALRRVAESYREQASTALERLAIYLPAFCTSVIGGAVVFCYAGTLFLPYYELMFRLGVSP
ncbi:MAG: type II secretion system F family protein [Planctomycetota bacterium]